MSKNRNTLVLRRQQIDAGGQRHIPWPADVFGLEGDRLTAAGPSTRLYSTCPTVKVVVPPSR